METPIFNKFLIRFHLLIAPNCLFKMLQTDPNSINNFSSHGDVCTRRAKKKTPCIHANIGNSTSACAPHTNLIRFKRDSPLPKKMMGISMNIETFPKLLHGMATLGRISQLQFDNKRFYFEKKSNSLIGHVSITLLNKSSHKVT